MSNRFFHESMRQEITCSACFVCLFFHILIVVCFFSPQDETDGISYNGLRQMGLISFQCNLSLKHVRDFRLRIPLWGSSSFVWCVVLNQGSCIFVQYNLLKFCCEWILIQSWTHAIDYSLPGLTWNTRSRVGIWHLSISGIVVNGRCYISHYFYFSFISYFCVIFYDCLLPDLCFLFFFLCLLTEVWATRNPYLPVYFVSD